MLLCKGACQRALCNATPALPEAKCGRCKPYTAGQLQAPTSRAEGFKWWLVDLVADLIDYPGQISIKRITSLGLGNDGILEEE